MPRNIMQLVHELNPLPTSVRRGFFMGFGQDTLRRSQAALTCNQGRSPAPRAARSSTAPGHSSCSARSSPPPFVFNGSTTGKPPNASPASGMDKLGTTACGCPQLAHPRKNTGSSHHLPAPGSLAIKASDCSLSTSICPAIRAGRRSLFAGI